MTVDFGHAELNFAANWSHRCVREAHLSGAVAASRRVRFEHAKRTARRAEDWAQLPMLASVPRQRTMTLRGKDHCAVQAVGRRARLTA